MFLYIIRHGEPDYASDSLTETGIKQAELLSERLTEVKFDKIFSSPLGRAKQTAMPTCIKQKMNFEVLPWLSENLAYDAMATDIDGKKNWWFSVQNTKYNTLEGAKKIAAPQTQAIIEATASSFDKFLEETGYKKNGINYQITANKYSRIAFFCHDGISKILLSYALLIPFHIFCSSFSIPHTGVTVLDFADTKDKITSPRCLTFSDISHLSGKLGNIYNNSFYI